MFDDEGTTVSGKGRWGNLPAAALVSSKEGKKLVEDGIKYTKETFFENLELVKQAINTYSKEELFEEGDKITEDMDLSLFKYRCHRLGMYQGPEIWLYDHEGSGIREGRHLEGVLNKWSHIYEGREEKNPYEGMDIWVVPADVHY